MLHQMFDQIWAKLRFYLSELNPAAALLCFGLCIVVYYAVLLLVRKGKPTRRDLIFGAVVSAYVTAVLSITILGRGNVDVREPESFFDSLARLFSRTSDAGYDVFFNIVLFMPLGFLLSYRLRLPWVCLVSAACTLAIETSQYLFSKGSFQATDVIANTLGGVAGVGVFHLVQHMKRELARKKLQAVCDAETGEILDESTEEK